MAAESAQWITVYQVMEVEGLRKSEVYRRCSPSDPKHIEWKKAPTGRGRVFLLSSLSAQAQRQWLERQGTSIHTSPQTSHRKLDRAQTEQHPSSPTTDGDPPAAADQTAFNFPRRSEIVRIAHA